jgi:hypothetical protein
LTNKNADTSSITVTVFEDGDTRGQSYILKTTLLDLDASSRSFFLQASDNGYYEIVFGNGVIGRAPKQGAVVEITYRITKGSLANGAREFYANFDPTSSSGATELAANTPVVVTLSQANNGANVESTESVRFMAPRHFQAQERCITATDYETALMEAFPEISAVSVYGGEEADPPQFGRVIVALDLRDINGFPDSKKDEYYGFLRARSPLKPVFVDPKFTFLAPRILVRYNVNITPVSTTAIETYVKTAVSNYNNTYLDKFGVEYRHSPFMRLIDDIDESIISNESVMLVYKKWNPTLNTQASYRIQFNLALADDTGTIENTHEAAERHTVWSAPFLYQGLSVILEDDGRGGLRLVRYRNDTHTKVVDVGTVNYATGDIVISNLNVSSYEGDAIKLYARPKSMDIVFPKDTIALIEPVEIEVEAVALKQ